jgi:NAD(P)-dependent dehydrogenase (short-subunit alcohol dehydrogenase family)
MKDDIIVGGVRPQIPGPHTCKTGRRSGTHVYFHDNTDRRKSKHTAKIVFIRERYSIMATTSKVIILTGASRGIGLAVAHYLLKNAHKVVVVARSEAPLRDLEKQYPNDQVDVLTGDLSDFTLGSKAVNQAIKRWKKLDAVIINHGVLDPVRKIADSTIEDWRAAYDVNFFSYVALAKAAIPALREAKGRIILTSSGAATNGYSTWGAYGSSKAAVNHLAKTLATEEKQITSIALRPGVVDTEMQRDIREKHNGFMDAGDAAKFAELKTSGGLLKPEQPGHVIAKLALDASNELSGQFLNWNAEELKQYQVDE